MLALVRGDDRLSETKLYDALPGASRPATDDEIRAAFGAGGGSLGPIGFSGEVIADETLREGQFVAGANHDGWHLRGVEAGRDFEPSFADLREPREGDRCPVVRRRAHLPDRDRGRPHLQLRQLLLGAARRDVPRRGRPGEAAARRQLRHRARAGDGRDRRAAPRRVRDLLARRRSRRTTSTSWRIGAAGAEAMETADEIVAALEEAGRSRPARRPRRARRREVRRRRPDRLPGPPHRRQEDPRGRAGRSFSFARAGPRSAYRSEKSPLVWEDCSMARKRRFSEEPFGETIQALMAETRRRPTAASPRRRASPRAT